MALSSRRFSYDGSLFAYGLAASGSDWFTIHVKDCKTGEVFNDKLEKCRYSGIDWTHDNKGFFYGCYPEMTDTSGVKTTAVGHQKLFYHRVGTDQKDDTLVVEFENNPKWMM